LESSSGLLWLQKERIPGKTELCTCKTKRIWKVAQVTLVVLADSDREKKGIASRKKEKKGKEAAEPKKRAGREARESALPAHPGLEKGRGPSSELGGGNEIDSLWRR